MSKKVVVYSAGWCQGCKVVKKVLTENNIEFEEVDIDTENGMNAAKQLGIRNIPVTVIGGNNYVGSSVGTIQLILQEAK